MSIGDQSRAWSLDLIAANGATNSELAGQPLVVLWQAGQSSALDTAELGAGRDIGSVGVFRPVVNVRQLTFRVSGGAFVDDETQTQWSVTGRGLAGPLVGEQLERINHLDTFWFAWSTYRPGTDLVES